MRGQSLREVGCEPSSSLEEKWSRQRGADPKLPEAESCVSEKRQEVSVARAQVKGDRGTDQVALGLLRPW